MVGRFRRLTTITSGEAPMHLFILALVSIALFVGGITFAFAEGMADQGDPKPSTGAIVAIIVGLVGMVISLCWGLNLLWHAIEGLF